MNLEPPLSPPGCLAILLALTDGMAAEGATARGDCGLGVAARYFIDELIEELVGASAEAPIPLDVAVLGYRSGEDGGVRLLSLLPGGDPTPRFVPLAGVAGLPAEPRAAVRLRRWVVDAEAGGPAPAAAALSAVYGMVGRWLAGRYATARPPVIVHCTAGEGLGLAYARIARSLTLLDTARGPSRLIHCGYSSDAPPTLPGGWSSPPLETWAVAWEASSDVPPAVDRPSPVRALAMNEWPIRETWDLLFAEAPPAEEESPAMPLGPDGPFERALTLWTQKLRSKAEEWEDAFAVEPASGMAAVADGASEGIFCRAWADLLARRYTVDRPDLGSTDAVNRWVAAGRAAWRQAIDYPNLRWSQQSKVTSAGAAATLLGLSVGPVRADGRWPWRAAAVGDSCLFWARDGRLHATFPIPDGDQLDSNPALVRANPGHAVAPLLAGGICDPGDLLILATDAVAGLLFRQADAPDADWDQYDQLDPDAWRDALDGLRQRGELVNDDCTLVALRVSGPRPFPRIPFQGWTHR